jgi:hypothetical protein
MDHVRRPRLSASERSWGKTPQPRLPFGWRGVGLATEDLLRCSYGAIKTAAGDKESFWASSGLGQDPLLLPINPAAGLTACCDWQVAAKVVVQDKERFCGL